MRGQKGRTWIITNRPRCDAGTEIRMLGSWAANELAGVSYPDPVGSHLISGYVTWSLRERNYQLAQRHYLINHLATLGPGLRTPLFHSPVCHPTLHVTAKLQPTSTTTVASVTNPPGRRLVRSFARTDADERGSSPPSLLYTCRPCARSQGCPHCWLLADFHADVCSPSSGQIAEATRNISKHASGRRCSPANARRSLLPSSCARLLRSTLINAAGRCCFLHLNIASFLRDYGCHDAAGGGERVR